VKTGTDEAMDTLRNKTIKIIRHGRGKGDQKI